MRFFLSLIIILISTITLTAQTKQIQVTSWQGTRYIPAYERQGTVYLSVKHFADALSINYFYNPQTEKFELKFADSNLKITARNPFLVLTSKTNEIIKVYQLPTSTYIVGTELFIPVEYSLDALKAASGKEIIYDKPAKLIIKDEIYKEPVLSEKIDEEKITKFFDITGITVDEKANGTLVRVISKKNITNYASSYANGVLTVVLKNSSVDEETVSKVLGKGLVNNIAAKNINGDSEIRLSLTKEYTTSEVISASGGSDILITIHNKIFSRTDERDKNKLKWDFDVIVIDAGHGGHDAGAIGINGVKEKDVNLGVSLKLGKLIEQNMKDVKVVYTRKTDTFVELYKRGKIANDNGGKLFISIHCNSAPKKSSTANGYEVYLLRPGRTQEAISIAERENSVIQYEDNPERYQKLTDENFILVSMAHSSYMRYSEKFSEILNQQFADDLPLASRGVKQAGFYVLVGASMPSVLIETAFLSNKKDADYLKSSKGQSEIAESIYNAVKKFKDHYQMVMESDL
jgi:N-acetylmuramoyl-L-alanine amidase